MLRGEQFGRSGSKESNEEAGVLAQVRLDGAELHGGGGGNGAERTVPSSSQCNS